MDGKVATPAALNGKVRTIPEIDKTLTIEGQCADAKATGDALAEHKSTLDGHTETLEAAQKDIASVTNRATETESRLNALEDEFNGASSVLSTLNERVNNGITEEINTIDNEVDGLDERVKSLEENAQYMRYGLAVSTGAFEPAKTYITSFANEYAKNLYTCAVALDFSLSVRPAIGEMLFTGLPKPALAVTFSVYNAVSNEAYSLSLQAEGNTGVIKAVKVNIPAENDSTRLVGYITYIVATDSDI